MNNVINFLIEHYYIIPVTLIGLLVLFFIVSEIIEEKKREKAVNDMMPIWEEYKFMNSPEYLMYKELDRLYSEDKDNG